MENEKNKNIGTIIISIAVVVAVLTTLGMISTPEYWFSIISNTSIKTFLMFFTYALIGWSGVVIYRMWYFPSPRRFLMIAYRFIWVLGIVFIGTPFGIASVGSFDYKTDTVTLSFTSAGGISSVMFAILIAGVLCLGYLYTELAKYERENGGPLE